MKNPVLPSPNWKNTQRKQSQDSASLLTFKVPQASSQTCTVLLHSIQQGCGALPPTPKPSASHFPGLPSLSGLAALL